MGRARDIEKMLPMPLMHPDVWSEYINRFGPNLREASNEKIRFLKPLSYSNYVNLQINSRAVLSDSGTINEESSILNLPAITIRNMHERPEGMDNGTLIMTGLKKKQVLNSLNLTLKLKITSYQRNIKIQSYKMIV